MFVKLRIIYKTNAFSFQNSISNFKMFARLVPSAALEIITKELNIASPSENEINDFIHYHALSKGNSDACGTLLVKARLQSMEQQLQVKTAEYEVSEKAKMRLEYNLEQSATAPFMKSNRIYPFMKSNRMYPRMKRNRM